MRLHNTSTSVLIAVIHGVAGCAVEPPGSATAEQDIYKGVETSSYPEAVLIDVKHSDGSFGRLCTGVALAPAVVLTAAHCVVGSSTYRVLVPATGQSIETANK